MAPASPSSSSVHSDGSSSHVLSAKYLERHTNKNDLIQRLRNILQVLQHDECIEADSLDYPGLAALCISLNQFVDHRDKQVRMYAVSACMELFTIYAPDAPWSTADTLNIFRQTIRQLANLAHTTSPSQANFHLYTRILELLAEVKIGVLLVELQKDGDEDTNQEALQVLAELFRTLLHSARNDHPHEVFEMAQKTISGCLEEYYEGYMIPTPLIDELLICIGQGPLVLVTNPAKAAEAAKRKKNSKKLPPHQVEQENPAYVVATAVVRKTVDRLSTPIANLLNGLLNADRRIVDESSILTKPPAESKLSRPQQQDQTAVANVWSIIYEFHRIAPSILTTVIGTLANYLTSPELEQRFMVVKLLGRLFCGANAKLALQFRPCFREWLRRTNDIEPKIRLIMVECLLKLIPLEVREIAAEAQQYLVKPLTEDSSHEVRLRTIYGLCDVAHRHRNIISPDLWQLVGTRVSAKHKQERKDAITGLAQNYFLHYISHHLAQVQAGGDDCPLDTVQNVLSTCSNNSGSDQYYWIPAKVFESASFTDAIDPDMHSRVIQVMDELLLGSELPHSSKRLTATARAVGLAVLIHSLQEESSNSYSWMCDLLKQRSRLQKALEKYLVARSQIRDFTPGSEDAFTADAKALDLLESVASLTAPPSSSPTVNPGERNPVLETFHRVKDKHIFRILSTITNPAHSSKARSRALDEMPKRVKHMGEATLTWVKTLVRRCSMGDFLNQEIVRHCILLAQECFQEEDIASSHKFLACVQVAADSFPEVCSNEECFGTLMELFVACRIASSSELKKVIGHSGIVTTLSTILSAVSPYTQLGKIDIDKSANEHLLSLCCRDGTPEQARHAVGTIAALFNPNNSERLTQEQNDSFSQLLESLTSPAKLTVSIKGTSTRLVTIFVALAELTQHAPNVFDSKRGQKAIRFSLDMVLLGRAHSSDSSDEDADHEETATPSPSKRRRKLSNHHAEGKHLSPGQSTSIVEDSSLSASCRTLCAAIEFLVSYIRAALLSSKVPVAGSPDGEAQEKSAASSELAEKLFETLSQIIRDHGVPPSSHDRKECRLRQDRAALRQCASIHLLRLCDPRLGLDSKFLTTERWHILAGAFLDDESVVRGAVMTELSLMLTGNGKFGKFGGHGAMVPLLRLVAFVALCVDGDHSAGHSIANGNAANVGKKASSIKAHAKGCITALRKAYEVTAAQARANGEEAEKRFEATMKVALMPEFIVPYAMHLLAFRRETPHAYANNSGVTQTSVDDDAIDGVGQRVLRKRLKWLFDPLVLSLGDSADNISFLLRMTELLGKYDPIRASKRASVGGELSYSARDDDEKGARDGSQRESAKLQVVCAVAREVLLSYVKKDVNLAVYPGKITLPAHLFRRRATLTRKNTSKANRSSLGIEQPSDPPIDDEVDINKALVSSKLMASQVSRESVESPSSKSVSGRTQVHFGLESPLRNNSKDPTNSFGNMSPIQKASPVNDEGEAVLLSSGEKTRGTTPPSVVRNTRFSASTSSAIEGTMTTESPFSKVSETSISNRSSQPFSAASFEDSTIVGESSKAGSTPELPRKRASLEEDATTPKRQKRLPAQIKINRNKSKPSVVTQKQKSKKTRGSSRKPKVEDDFDFDANSDHDGKVTKQARQGKENKSQPNPAARRRKSTRALKTR